MQLASIAIHLTTYGPNEGKYTGTANFKGQYGSVEVVLSPSVSDKVLALCADAIVENARVVAQDITAATLTQVSSPALEHRD